MVSDGEKQKAISTFCPKNYVILKLMNKEKTAPKNIENNIFTEPKIYKEIENANNA